MFEAEEGMMLRDAAAGVPTMANAWVFAQSLGAAGVASALENGMLDVCEPLVLGAVQSALLPVEDPLSSERREYLRVLMGLDGSMLPEGRALFYKEELGPALREHAQLIDEALREASAPAEVVSPRAGSVRVPSAEEAYAFLRDTGVRGLESGVRTAMFGPQAVDQAFTVLEGALHAFLETTSSPALRNIVGAFEASRAPDAPEGMKHLLLGLLSRHEAFTDAALKRASAASMGRGPQCVDERFYRKIETFKLSTQVRNILHYQNIHYLGELCQVRARDLEKWIGVGRKAFREIADFLQGLDLSLDMRLDGFKRPAVAPRPELFYRRVDTFQLSARTLNALSREKVEYVGELCQLSRRDIEGMRNAGRKTYQEIVNFLEGLGLALDMQLDGFKRPTDALRPEFYRKLNTYPLPLRIRHLLREYDIVYLGELCQLSRSASATGELMEEKMLPEVMSFLEGLGLSLGMQLDGFERPAVTLRPEFYRRLDALPLSARALKFISRKNIECLGELCQLRANDLIFVANCDMRAFHEVLDFLEGLGLSLGMQLDSFQHPSDPVRRG